MGKSNSTHTQTVPSFTPTPTAPDETPHNTTTDEQNHPSPPDPTSYEATHVHAIYTSIAPHFSLTRHKPWPLVSSFLLALPSGSIGLDVGTGNGKYLPLRDDIFILASDRSEALVKIANGQSKTHDLLVADALGLPHRRGSVDFVICIAVVHHLASEERRVECIKGVLDCLRENGEALIYVWALEQGGSRRGWDVGDKQDVLVPWIMKEGVGQDGEVTQERTFQRYYHLSKEGELEGLVERAGGRVVKAGYERDNWWVIAARRS